MVIDLAQTQRRHDRARVSCQQATSSWLTMEEKHEPHFLSTFMGFEDCIKAVLLHSVTVWHREKVMLIVQCPDHIVHYISVRVSEAVNRTGIFIFCFKRLIKTTLWILKIIPILQKSFSFFLVAGTQRWQGPCWRPQEITLSRHRSRHNAHLWCALWRATNLTHLF